MEGKIPFCSCEEIVNPAKKVEIIAGKLHIDGNKVGDVISEKDGRYEIRWANGSFMDGTIIHINTNSVKSNPENPYQLVWYRSD